MPKIKIMINGIPGNVAVIIAKHALSDDRFELIPHSLTGPEVEAAAFTVDSTSVGLIPPTIRTEKIEGIKQSEGTFISVDFTHPLAVNDNAGFYCRHQLPFVMGTTGGDRKKLMDTVSASSIAAVIAPNMAKQIVGFQAMMEYAADTFPNLFNGYTLHIRESHQQGKADTSGTAKAMIRYFNALGIPCSEKDIAQERDPEIQRSRWGVPEDFLGGHAWHTYTLDSKDKTAHFEFVHNINGRDIYAEGTLDAVAYLYEKLKDGRRGKVYTMIDVLKGA